MRSHLPCHLINTPLPIRLKYGPHLIAYPPEYLQFFRLAPFRFGWIIKRPVVTIRLAGKHWAGLVRMAAHSDHRFDLALQKVAQ